MDKILIANRGEIARRVMRTCRSMGIRTVAVYSEPDRDAPFVHEADEAVPLCGATSVETYLKIDAIVDAAVRTGAQGVHPGYGFLAENADLAERCAASSVTFIGPTPEAMRAMGSKIEAKRRMQDSGVAVLPSIAVNEGSGATIGREAAALGFPILVKASAGGGGRGMRIVRRAEELAAAVDAAQKEALSSFGDATVFLEPCVENPRHVEVQIFGDTHGNVVHLFERECSIQRRHQKIVEESPSVALDEPLRAAMTSAAVRAGEAIGYVGAGTVEFLLAPDRRFYFLEMNTRLQVEHPVTECLTGLDLVRLQIEVARGQALPASIWQASTRGHAIEVRLYAEDPRHDFAPSIGTLHRFFVESGEGVRVESGVVDGSQVTPYYDAMLAKVIVHAATRDEAAHRLADVLSRAQIHGLRTNRELLVRILRHSEFLAGNTDTQFLERHSPVELSVPLAAPEAERWHAAAAALALQAQQRRAASVLASLPSGWRNNPSQRQVIAFEGERGTIEVAYQFRRGGVDLAVDGSELDGVHIECCTAERVDMAIDGMRRRYDVHVVGDTCYVDSPLGSTELHVRPRFPEPGEEVVAGSLVAPLPGVVSDIKVAVGDRVEPGDVLIVLESMKMLYPVTAPTAGRVAEIRVQKASHVEARSILAVIDATAE